MLSLNESEKTQMFVTCRKYEKRTFKKEKKKKKERTLNHNSEKNISECSNKRGEIQRTMKYDHFESNYFSQFVFGHF
jgi:hypothetical protein